MNEPAWGSRERPWPISATDLDNWEIFVRPDEFQEWQKDMSDQDFIDRLNRVDKPGGAAIIGKCLHTAMETWMGKVASGLAQAAKLPEITGEADGATVTFRFECDVLVRPYVLAEQDMEFAIETAGGWVNIRCKTDGIYGNIVRDLKTTRRYSAMKYAESWQWKVYLQAMGDEYRRFEYHVFVLKYSDDAKKAVEEGGKAHVRVSDFRELPVYRYPAMFEDIRSVAGEVAQFAQLIGWEPPPKRPMLDF